MMVSTLAKLMAPGLPKKNVGQFGIRTNGNRYEVVHIPTGQVHWSGTSESSAYNALANISNNPSLVGRPR